MAQTLMAGIPCLTRTCSWLSMVPHMKLLLSHLHQCFHAVTGTKTLTAEVSYIGLGSLESRAQLFKAS